jgi:Uma2 family endonuclease
MSSIPQKRIPPEEYLRRERAAETKSEYDDGVVYAMAGAARRHNVILAGVLHSLESRLSARCEVYPSDMKVRIHRPTRYFYPDASVACGELQFEDGHEDVLLNPLVIIEVLSDSTERYDRGRKFNAYQTIESLQEYVLVSTDGYLVEHFSREGDQWLYSKVEGRDATLPLPAANCELPLREIYHRVDLPA